MCMAAPSCGSVVLLSWMLDRVEYVLDARSLSRVRTSMARNAVLAVRQDVTARKLVSLPRWSRFERR
jgi:hypothetical protein